jgi:lysozyme family protein
LFQSLILSVLLLSSQPVADYSCVDEYAKHPVRNEFMLQIVLKSYNYYTGEIDGAIGPNSINALKDFQRSNNAVVDGILGPETCYKLLNKSTLVKKKKSSLS